MEHGRAPNSISAQSIRAQLDRIVSNEAFSRSERRSRFLRFTVDQRLQLAARGRSSDRLKGLSHQLCKLLILCGGTGLQPVVLD
jgi:hypothetical protein